MAQALSPAQVESLERQDRLAAILSPFLLLIDAFAMRFVFRYGISNLSQARGDLSRRLESHRGPIIIVSNHLSHADPYLVGWLLLGAPKDFHPAGVRSVCSTPWTIADEFTHSPEGADWRGRLLGWWTYLCRAIYVRRKGDDDESLESRRSLVWRALWALRRGGWIGFFPEATRSRSGWLDASRTHLLAGELAEACPDAAFLCVYIRGESQSTWCDLPKAGESFRAYVDWIHPSELAEKEPAAVSHLVIERLGGLQSAWFKESFLSKNCSGSCVVDLRTAGGAAAREQAAKGACRAALLTAGLPAEAIDIDLFRETATERTSGTEVRFRFAVDDAEKVLCLAMLRGGRLGDESSPGDIAWRVEPKPEGADPASSSKEALLRLIAESSDDLKVDELKFDLIDGLEKVLLRGKPQDWGASISHSGRFVACSFMTS
jgi:1-acyl-sn-glycerol-3-phosphate acyltransferase